MSRQLLTLPASAAASPYKLTYAETANLTDKGVADLRAKRALVERLAELVPESPRR